MMILDWNDNERDWKWIWEKYMSYRNMFIHQIAAEKMRDEFGVNPVYATTGFVFDIVDKDKFMIAKMSR